MTTLGVVTARAGSKGIPGKNVHDLAGRALIAYTFAAAAQSRLLDRFVVSTDSDAVVALAEAADVEVVHRPPEFAHDESPTEDALIHALETVGGTPPDWVVTLEPTSPLRSPRLIDACIALAVEHDAGSVITVAETSSLVGRLDGSRFRYLEPGQPRRRQLRAPLYRESSTVYVTKTARLLDARSVLAEPLYAVVTSAEESIDINTYFDLELAEAVLQRRGAGT
jgi:N-acylneuraminate cytidylyltransferase